MLMPAIGFHIFAYNYTWTIEVDYYVHILELLLVTFKNRMAIQRQNQKPQIEGQETQWLNEN